MTNPSYKPAALNGLKVPARAVWVAGSWIAQVQTVGSAWYTVRRLQSPKTLGDGAEVAGEQVNKEGVVRGYLCEADLAQIEAAVAVLGTPEVDLPATRAELARNYNALREADYAERRNAISAMSRNGRAPAVKDRGADIAAARQDLDVFDAAHPQVLAEIEAERKAATARFLAAD